MEVVSRGRQTGPAASTAKTEVGSSAWWAVDFVGFSGPWLIRSGGRAALAVEIVKPILALALGLDARAPDGVRAGELDVFLRFGPS